MTRITNNHNRKPDGSFGDDSCYIVDSLSDRPNFSDLVVALDDSGYGTWTGEDTDAGITVTANHTGWCVVLNFYDTRALDLATMDLLDQAIRNA